MVASVSWESWKLALRLACLVPVIMPVPRGEACEASPPGGSGHQAARVHRINRDVGANGGVRGGFDLRLIFDAGLADAARKINQRFLFGEHAQLAGRIFERAQLAVGVKDIELGFVGGEASAVVAFIGGGGGQVRQVGALARWSAS